MAMIPDADRDFLRAKFADQLENHVTIMAFTKRPEGVTKIGLECEFCSETEDLMEELSELSELINVELREYSPNDPVVKDFEIDKLPALVLVRNEQKGVRYFGIPGGFEFASFIEDLVDVSRNETDMAAATKGRIRGIEKDVHIQVFVTPTCPYCPPVVRMAHRMAIENPQHVKADAIEAAEFPHLVSKYGIAAVPTIVINGRVEFQGALPEDEFAGRVAEVAAA